MARWEPDAQDRLLRAALDLFAEQGYDRTTVIEIAQRAGLAKSTFFRHFHDKREVLFSGQDLLNGLLAEGITNAPSAATPLDAVEAALDTVATIFTPARREYAPALLAALADNSELRERDALKRRGFADTMTEALRRRGIPDRPASVAAWLGVLAFGEAYSRWADPANHQGFDELARQALRELRTTIAELR
ncbi:TetR/AcrR family transcriptional regulator [Micromonospora sp. HNM0581]|uniref:TetR/AcrR family transcriptional regulator n=1 Tax=Micromonospora sp. HNM0581 TaxID=2716341 RepID=UPI00146B3914|nr:TetR/AcrR family transcriptional regulator [Micromonospora sp. HNM0581]NLU80323.1 TetR/AcrR family transcriptional regulator [Micromonospora sp. HNM0581]